MQGAWCPPSQPSTDVSPSRLPRAPTSLHSWAKPAWPEGVLRRPGSHHPGRGWSMVLIGTPLRSLLCHTDLPRAWTRRCPSPTLCFLEVGEPPGRVPGPLGHLGPVWNGGSQVRPLGGPAVWAPQALQRCWGHSGSGGGAYPPHPVLPADGCLVGPEPLGEPGPGLSPSHVLLGSSVFTAVPSVGSPVRMGKLRHGAMNLLPGNPAGRPWAEVSTLAVPAESSFLLAD